MALRKVQAGGAFLSSKIEIKIKAYDETTTVIPVGRIIRRFRRNSNQGLICLVGYRLISLPVRLTSPVAFASMG
jgi:hypothetical protein